MTLAYPDLSQDFGAEVVFKVQELRIVGAPHNIHQTCTKIKGNLTAIRLFYWL